MVNSRNKFKEYNKSGYYVSKDGVVIGKKGFILKPGLSSNGYYTVSVNGISICLHRLVAETYIPNPKNKSQVNHIDSNRINNNINNLEWCTPKENQVHSWSSGDRNRSKKLNKLQVRIIRESVNDLPRKYLADIFNIHVMTIGEIVRKEIWKNV